MTTWHGYDQHPDADEKRPWWRHKQRLVAGSLDPEPRHRVWCWVRTDGRWLSPTIDFYGRCCDDEWWEHDGQGTGYSRPTSAAPDAESMMTRVDREHPLPAPGPQCGQVWVRPNDKVAATLTAVGPSRLCWGDMTITERAEEPWPPPNAVLVAGPGSPWAPPEKEAHGG